MTGLERNADVVRMASYAPLFAHVDAWQWTPDLIWFDNLRAFGTPNYYVQKLFGTNTGTKILPMTINGATAAAQSGLYASASLDGRTDDIVVKVVNAETTAKPVRIALEGVTLARQSPHACSLERRPASREFPGSAHASGAGGIAGAAGRGRSAPGTAAAVGHRGAAGDGTVNRLRAPALMPSRQATKNVAGIAILNHITYGSMLRLKASAAASSSVTRAPARRPPILDASHVAAAAAAPHMSPATASTQPG